MRPHFNAFPLGVPSTSLLARDATNRALRTVIQGFVATFLVGASSAVVAALNPGTNLFDVSTLRAIGVSATTGGVIAVLSYVMRRFADPSALPTPLPPAPQAAPADPS